MCMRFRPAVFSAREGAPHCRGLSEAIDRAAPIPEEEIVTSDVAACLS